MTKVKTADLIGPALDWAVAESEGLKDMRIRRPDDDVLQLLWFGAPGPLVVAYSPSADWSQGGPLIEKFPLKLMPNDWKGGPKWLAWIRLDEHKTLGLNGETPLIAACRAIVAAKLGDEVDIPEELFTPAAQ